MEISPDKSDCTVSILLSRVVDVEFIKSVTVLICSATAVLSAFKSSAVASAVLSYGLPKRLEKAAVPALILKIVFIGSLFSTLKIVFIFFLYQF